MIWTSTPGNVIPSLPWSSASAFIWTHGWRNWQNRNRKHRIALNLHNLLSKPAAGGGFQLMPSIKFFRYNVRHAVALVILFLLSFLDTLRFALHLPTFREYSLSIFFIAYHRTMNFSTAYYVQKTSFWPHIRNHFDTFAAIQTAAPCGTIKVRNSGAGCQKRRNLY